MIFFIIAIFWLLPLGVQIFSFTHLHSIENSAEHFASAPRLAADADLSAYEGKLLAVEGDLQDASCLIKDTWLRESPVLALWRKVEVYAYDETKNSNGNSYSLRETWTEWPKEESDFQGSQPKVQPQKTQPSLEWLCEDITIGGQLAVENEQLGLDKQKLLLSKENVLEKASFRLANEEFLFSGKGSLYEPQLGDMRISYYFVPNPIKKQVLFALYKDEKLQAYPLAEGQHIDKEEQHNETYTLSSKQYIYESYPASKSNVEIAETVGQNFQDYYLGMLLFNFFLCFLSCSSWMLLISNLGLSYYFSRERSVLLSSLLFFFSSAACFALAQFSQPFLGSLGALFGSHSLFLLTTGIIIYFTRWKADV